MGFFEELRTVEGYSKNCVLEIDSCVKNVFEEVGFGGRKVSKVVGFELNYSRGVEGFCLEYEVFLLEVSSGRRLWSFGDF